MEHISSRNNQKIVNTAKLTNKKYRDCTSLFVFEGYKVFTEALSAGVEFADVFVREDVLNKYPELSDVNCVTSVSESVFKKLSDDVSGDGIYCVAHKFINKDYSGDKKIMAISVRDPGNVGTIIRSALAFGIDELIFSSDCADIYSPKVVRSAMGALFRQKITVTNNPIKTISDLKCSGYSAYATTLSENSVSVNEIDINSKTCFIIGNEGHGLDKEIISICDKQVIIPINEHSESLNAAVAASVLMWEISRRTQ